MMRNSKIHAMNRLAASVVLCLTVCFGVGCGDGEDNDDDTDTTTDTGADGDTDSDTDSNVDTDTGTGTETDTETDTDTDTDTDTGTTVTFSGIVKVSAEIGSGAGLLCVGLLRNGCPTGPGPKPEALGGDIIKKVNFKDAKTEQPFSFEVEAVVDADYGLAAVLVQSKGATECDQFDSGDLEGCNDIAVIDGQDIADETVTLDFEMP